MAQKSMFDKLRAQLKDINGAEITVGIQSESGINFAGQTVSSDDELKKIAWVHEFGMDIEVTPKMRAWLHHNGIHLKAETTKIHIPERSYIRRSYHERNADFNKKFSDLIGDMFDGKVTGDELLDRLGEYAMRETIAGFGEGNTKPVTDYTLEHRKENPNPSPLIDTGDLMGHITYRVEKKGGAK